MLDRLDSLDLNNVSVSQFATETGREFQTDGAAVLKERLPKEVRLNGTCSSGADDDRNDHVLLRVVMCRLRYSGTCDVSLDSTLSRIGRKLSLYRPGWRRGVVVSGVRHTKLTHVGPG